MPVFAPRAMVTGRARRRRLALWLALAVPLEALLIAVDGWPW